MAAELIPPDEETVLFLLSPSQRQNPLSPDLQLLEAEAKSYRRIHRVKQRNNSRSVTTRRMMHVVACRVEDVTGQMQRMVPVQPVVDVVQAVCWEIPSGVVELLTINLRRDIAKEGGVGRYIGNRVFRSDPPKQL